MFGFACDETPDLMPATLDYSHKILERMAADRKSGDAAFLEPDAKSQVTLKFEDGKPVAATAIVVSTQHAKGYHEGDREAELKAYVKSVVADVLPVRPAFGRHRLSHQPDRRVRNRRARRRRRADGSQDHRRYLWRRGPAWRRRVFRQGSDQGRSVGRLYHPLSGEEHRRRRPRHALHDPAGLCHRRVGAAVALCRYAWHGERRGYRRDAGRRHSRHRRNWAV